MQARKLWLLFLLALGLVLAFNLDRVHLVGTEIVQPIDVQDNSQEVEQQNNQETSGSERLFVGNKKFKRF